MPCIRKKDIRNRRAEEMYDRKENLEKKPPKKHSIVMLGKEHLKSWLRKERAKGRRENQNRTEE